MNYKKQVKRKNPIARLGISLCIVTATVLLSGCSVQEHQVATENSGSVYTEEATLPLVEVVMEEYSFTYAGEKALVIASEKTDNGLAFFADLENEKMPIFTLVYNSQEGDIVVILGAESDKRVPVAFLMHEMPDGLSDEDMQKFILAQESVNEIVESIKLN